MEDLKRLLSYLGPYRWDMVIGAVMIATIDSAIPQLDIGNSMITEFIKGILLLFAILLNVILQRVADKQALARRGI